MGPTPPYLPHTLQHNLDSFYLQSISDPLISALHSAADWWLDVWMED